MATRGWQNVTMADLQPRRSMTTRPKYGNVKVRINGEVFDSKREAACWQGLKAREHNGEITELRRQVVFPLCGPVEDRAVHGRRLHRRLRVHRARRAACRRCQGAPPALYQLKKKWLFLQDGIDIEEV